MSILILKSDEITGNYDSIHVINHHCNPLDGVKFGMADQIFATKNIVRDQLDAMTYVAERGEAPFFDKSFEDFVKNNDGKFHFLQYQYLTDQSIGIIVPKDIHDVEQLYVYMQQNNIFNVPIGHEEVYFIKHSRGEFTPLFLKVPYFRNNDVYICIETIDEDKFFKTGTDQFHFRAYSDGEDKPNKIEVSNGTLYFVFHKHNKDKHRNSDLIRKQFKSVLISEINRELFNKMDKAVEQISKIRIAIE